MSDPRENHPHDHDQPHDPSVELVLHARVRSLGDGISVRRILPDVERRMVGPFIFFDHMGPMDLAPGVGMDVRPHPHINLATVTYLFEGAIVHKDSLGSDITIRPGAVNWMTAGRGITHSERSSAEDRVTGQRVHGIQLWVAFPKAFEEIEPSFSHTPADAIPRLHQEGADLRVIVGTAYGVTSPVVVPMPMFYVEAKLAPKSYVELPEFEERAAYVVEGAVEVGGERFEEGHMIIFRGDQDAVVNATSEGSAHVMLLGGAPLDGPRHIFWNFVSSSKERIEMAKDDWRNGRFPKVRGDEVEFIPLPE